MTAPYRRIARDQPLSRAAIAWAYLIGPVAGAVVAAGIAYILRGPGGGVHGTEAAQGTLAAGSARSS